MTTNQSRTLPVVSLDYADAGTPGVEIEVDAAEAERLGATEETALDLADAWDANADLAEGRSDG